VATEPLRLRNGLEIPAAEIEVEYARSGGPGGQHVNKTETKVTLRFDVNASSLPDAIKEKLKVRLASRLTKNSELLISSEAHRERPRNLEIARERMTDVLSSALIEPKKRTKTKPSRGAKKRRLADKRKTSEKKQGRGRVKED
jgi:ribosome-associated protein